MSLSSKDAQEMKDLAKQNMGFRPIRPCSECKHLEEVACSQVDRMWYTYCRWPQPLLSFRIENPRESTCDNWCKKA